MASPTFVITGASITPVTALPTTAAHLSLWNAAPVGGKSLYIQTIAAITNTSAGAAQIVQCCAHLGAGPKLSIGGSPSAISGPFNLSGPLQPTVAVGGSSVTIVNDSVWHPCSMSATMGAGTTTIANDIFSMVNGLYVVAPGVVFSLATLCSAAGSATCKLAVTWIEQ